MRTSQLAALLVPALLIGALVSCSDTAAPPGPVPLPNAEISDAVHSGGNRHFYLLPPLALPLPYGGTFDGSLSPEVDVCEWNVRCVAVIARFSMTTGTGGQTIHVDPRTASYYLLWDTDRCVSGACRLDPAKTYRIRIRVLATELGHADIDVLGRLSELRSVDTKEYIPLINGITLPIRFRIEKGALFVATPSATETQIFTTEKSADGSTAALTIPPGGLTATMALTMEAAAPAETPVDTRLAGKTVYRFGPDGSMFPVPLTVTIGYDPAGLAAGTDQSKLRLYWTERAVDGTISWSLVPNSRVDLVNHTVSGEVSHFSYGTIGSVSCDQTTPTPSTPLTLYVHVSSPAVAAFCDDDGTPMTGRMGWGVVNGLVARADFDGTNWTLFGTGLGTTDVAVSLTSEAEVEIGYTTTTATVIAPPTTFADMASEYWVTVGQGGIVDTRLWWSPGDGAFVSPSDISWTMANPDIAAVALDSVNYGDNRHAVYIYGVSEGTTALTVALPGFSQSTVIRSTPVASVQIVGMYGVDTIAVGTTQQLAATAYDVNGVELPGRLAVWSTSDAAVVTVDQTGLMTAVGRGDARVVAWIDGRSYDLWVQAF